MKLSAYFALVPLVVAAPVIDSRDASPLKVKIERVGNSKIRAVVSNRGTSALNILKTGTVLDHAGVEKAQVYSQDNMDTVPFEGIRVIIDHGNLPSTAFVHIPAGGTAASEFDVAELHNLGQGGDYNIQTTGSFHYARDDSTTIEGAIAYKSNEIDAHIDGRQASSAYNVYHAKRAEKRSQIGSGCTGDKLVTAQNALAGCAKRAQGAYEAAVNGSSAKMEEYFKSSSQATRSTVAQAFKKMAAECGTTNSGSTGYACTDIDNYCEQSGAVAYAELNVGSTVYCEKYFTDIQPFSTQCHYGDQAGVTIHEMSHLTQIKGTSDFAGYGYDFVRSLSAEQNLNHADTYMLFANAIQVGC